MFDQDVIASEVETLRRQIGKLLGLDLTPELAVQLYEAAMGVESMELYRVITFYAQEADKCRQSGAYFSACLMLTSAIEALLATFCLLSQPLVEETAIFRGIAEGMNYKEKILQAHFEKFIQLAERFDWVPSDAVAPDLLAAAIQDFPLVVANLFPKISDESKVAKLEAFKANPGIEMLRFLQHLRNLVHPGRWPRFGITASSPDLENDCKFVFVIGYQVMECLFNAMSRISKDSVSQLQVITDKSPPELRAILSRFALDIIKVGRAPLPRT